MAATTVTAKISNSNGSDIKLAYILGALFGDGCFYQKDRGRVLFSSSDKEFTKIMQEHLNDLFDLDIKMRINKLSSKNKNWKDAYVITSRPLFRVLREFSDKEIPDFILNGNKLIKASFLKGFFDADGNVDIHIIKKRNELQRHVRCFNNNRKMLELIQEFLQELDIDSCIGKGKKQNLCLTIWGYKNLINFENYINFNINRKRLALKNAIKSYKQIQTQWNKETYNKVMELRTRGLGATLIQREIKTNISRPTIESWIYRGVKSRR